MLRRMAGVWLAGLGLVAGALAQDAPTQATEAQIKAARRKMQSAIGVVGSMTRKLYQQDKDLAALKEKRDQAVQAMEAALRQVMAKTPEGAALVTEEAGVVDEMAKLDQQMTALRQQMTALRAKRKESMAKQQAVRKKLGAPRGKAMRDPSIAPLRKAAAEADKVARDAARAKLMATPEGKKAVEDMEAARKAYYTVAPPKKRAPRKPRVRKGGKGKKGKPAPK